ncbi:MAG TPA: HAMP domain-containing sensor histidine kinase, partial [Longimicrobiales bacterium]
VLREYVAFATYQLQQNTRTALHDCMQAWLNPILDSAHPEKIVVNAAPDCGNTADARFDINFANGAVATYGRTPMSARLVHWLADTIPHHPSLPYLGDWHLAVLAGPDLTSDEIIAYAVQVRGDRPVRAVGMVARSSLHYILGAIVDRASLLPPELTKGLRNDAFFQTQLVQSAVPSPFAASEVFAKRANLEAGFGGLALDLKLKPAAIERIVPGGIPRDRSFELFSLFGLAGLLVVASLLLLKRQAELARERAGFVSSVSHELRTPLAQIRMFAEMLLLGRVRSDADRRRSLEIIDKEARRLSHLVENVLQAARAERGAVRVNPEETRLAPVVRDTVENFMVLVEAREVEFRLELQEDLVVSADPEAVRQILLNLLDNAAKYGPQGQRVVVGLALFNDAARLWIDDEGPGIPVRERERVFETFYRSARDLTSHTTGSGIGLGVVRELASLHGGSAWVEDAPGAGARVVVEFPGAYVARAEGSATDWAVA